MDLIREQGERFYISARKKNTEEEWLFVRRHDPGMRVPDPFAMSELDILSYVSRLERRGYETIVTRVEGRLDNTHGIWVGNPNTEAITRRVVDGFREIRGEFDSGYTGDLTPPRR